MKFYLTCLYLSALLVLVNICNANILASWDVNGLNVSEDLSASDYEYSAYKIAGNVKEAKLSLANVNPSDAGNQYGFKIDNGDETYSLSDAITAEHYLQFSIEVENGYVLNLTEVGILGESTSTGADDIALLANVKGFDASSAIHTDSGVSADSWDFTLNDLSSDAAFQNCSGTIAFRLYGWDTNGTTGVTRIRDLSEGLGDGDDLQIKGTVTAIPEPGTFFLIVGSSSIILFRRGRRISA